nr:hypothetical protein [Rhodanobacter glycinis]
MSNLAKNEMASRLDWLGLSGEARAARKRCTMSCRIGCGFSGGVSLLA